MTKPAASISYKRNTIELTTHTVTVIDENIVIKLAVSDGTTGVNDEIPAFEENIDLLF